MLVIYQAEVVEAFEVSSRTEVFAKKREISGAPNARAYPPSCSSKALASFRSAVSKPSVNQP